MATNIEYVEDTWNPLGGCEKISEGCKNCYAINMAWRLAHIPATKGRYLPLVYKTENGNKNWSGTINLFPDVLMKPLKAKKPTKYLISMTDLFHKDVPFDYIDKVFAVMALCERHTFLITTKRADVMADYFSNIQYRSEAIAIEAEMISGLDREHKRQDWALPLHNVWLGVSVENQKAAQERIPHLLMSPAAVHWLSIEPLLGPVDITEIVWGSILFNPLTGVFDLPEIPHPRIEGKIDWVVVGGESGNNARGYHPEWIYSLQKQCENAKVPFFFKQWGEWYTRWRRTAQSDGKSKPHFMYWRDYLHFTQKLWADKDDICVDMDGNVCKIGKDFMNAKYPVVILSKVGKKEAGRLLNGFEYNAMPSFSTINVESKT